MSQTADVIIIGGGVQGASLAFHLAQRGLDVIVLEKRFVGAGATGRSSGLVRMHYDNEVDSRLAWESFKYFTNWEDRVGGDCGFTRTGFIQIVARDQQDKLRANVAMHQRIGIPSLVITADDVKRLAPSFAAEDFDVAAYEPESGYAMPSDTASALMAAARERGVRLVQGTAVTGIRVTGGKVDGVDTTQGSFSAPVVVNAAGAWAGQINQMVGLDVPYDTWRHDTMFVARPAEVGPSHPTVIDFPKELYFRPEGGLTLVGLEDGNPLGESPDSDTDHAKPGFVERAIDRICLRVPVMDQGGLHSAHGGYDGITPDQHPLLGAYGPDGFYLDCGHSGTGFKTAPAVGRCMAELIVDGAAKTVDISPFAPDRFAKGKPFKGNYETIWR
ncbi:MAG: FAD-binding oxidoreductase [Anaerolineae bacterium]|nr:FAD-binding oxidoreductase [Anaerolineae bacterium]